MTTSMSTPKVKFSLAVNTQIEKEKLEKISSFFGVWHDQEEISEMIDIINEVKKISKKNKSVLFILIFSYEDNLCDCYNIIDAKNTCFSISEGGSVFNHESLNNFLKKRNASIIL
jgi:hypothetical protein